MTVDDFVCLSHDTIFPLSRLASLVSRKTTTNATMVPPPGAPIINENKFMKQNKIRDMMLVGEEKRNPSKEPADASRQLGKDPMKELRVVDLHGVDPERRADYSAGVIDFKCDKGSMTIPLSRVNDDFCDCADGSDEPGTSACDNGHFYCKYWADNWTKGSADPTLQGHTITSSKVSHNPGEG